MKKKKELTPERREHLKRIGTQPGQPSRNPAGRPPKDDALKAKIGEYSEELVDRLKEIAMNGKNEASAVKAAETLLSYIMTKASTRHEHEHKHEMTNIGEFMAQINRERQIEGYVIEATDVAPVINTRPGHPSP